MTAWTEAWRSHWRTHFAPPSTGAVRVTVAMETVSMADGFEIHGGATGEPDLALARSRAPARRPTLFGPTSQTSKRA